MNVVLDARRDELLEVRAVQRRALAERWSRESVECAFERFRGKTRRATLR